MRHYLCRPVYRGSPLQSSNLDSRLRAFGFQTTLHFLRFPEVELVLGGPIPVFKRWAFFTSLGTQYVSKVLPDFAVRPTTHVYSGLLRLDGMLRPRDRLSALASGQIVRNSNLNAGAGIEPSATLLRVFGGPYSTVDPDLKRPYTDERGIGLEYRIAGHLQAGVRGMQRSTMRLVHTENVGVPPSAYLPTEVMDPGDDNVAGSSDDQVLTMFNQDPRKLGEDRYLLTNPAGLNSRYIGLEANLTGGPYKRGFVSVSFAAYKSEGDGNPGNSEFENDPGVIGALFDNPNTRISARGRLFFDRAYVAKVAAYYEAPLGLHLGSVVNYFDGLPFGRKLIIADLNQGPFYVMATPRGAPGGFRTQYALTFDQRISSRFSLGRHEVSVMVDIFNLMKRGRCFTTSH